MLQWKAGRKKLYDPRERGTSKSAIGCRVSINLTSCVVIIIINYIIIISKQQLTS
jgi:hypothetical protein